MRSLLPWPLVALAACSSFGSEATPPNEPVSDGGTSSPEGGTTQPLPDGSVDDAGVDVTPGPATIEPPLPGPKLWLDARKMTLGPSKTWTDSSTNGAHAVGAVAINTVASAINGHPALRFLSEANQGMKVPAGKLELVLADGFAIFVVAKAFPKSPAPTFPTLVERLSTTPTNGVWIFWQVPANPLVLGSISSYAAPIPNDRAVTLTPDVMAAHVYAMRVADGGLTFTVDGAVSAPIALESDNPSFPMANQLPFTVGASGRYPTADYAFSGDIGSVTVYTSKVDDMALALAVQNLKAAWTIP